MEEENNQSAERHQLEWDRPRLKEIAKRQLEGRWTTPILALLVMAFVLGIIYFVYLAYTFKDSFMQGYAQGVQESSQNLNSEMLEEFLGESFADSLDDQEVLLSAEDYDVQADKLIKTTFVELIFSILMAALSAVFLIPFVKVLVTLSRTREKAKFSDYMASFSGTGKNFLAGLWQFLWEYIWILIPTAIILFASYYQLKYLTPFLEEGNTAVALQSLLCSLLIFLASIASIVISIIKKIQYRYMFNIIAENPSISVRKALTLSKKITNGYKLKLFAFDLSYLGWGMLGVIVLPVLLYVFPYMNMADLNAYHVIKNNAIVNGIVKEEDF
jgi:uncharacterized membrane protein